MVFLTLAPGRPFSKLCLSFDMVAGDRPIQGPFALRKRPTGTRHETAAAIEDTGYPESRAKRDTSDVSGEMPDTFAEHRESESKMRSDKRKRKIDLVYYHEKSSRKCPRS